MKDEPTVLFVEDDAKFVQALSMEFRGKYNTMSVRDAEDGLDKLRELNGAIDVAVVDLIMWPRGRHEPDEKAGLTFVWGAKGKPGKPGLDPELEIIILSGNLTPEIIDEAKAAGVHACIAKGNPGFLEELDSEIVRASIKTLRARGARLQARIDHLASA